MTGTDTHAVAVVEPLLGPGLTAEQARQIFEQGAEATVFALLTLAKMVAEKQALAHAQRHRAIRHEAALPEACPERAAQRSGPQSRACRQPPAATDPHRSYRNTRPRFLPRLRRTGYAVSRWTHTADRGYPARHHGRSHPAYDPPLLVPALSESGRARGVRCVARFDLGPARAGPVGVAALRLGQHAGADCRTSSTTTCV